jgi:hypothetical protein
MKTKLAFVVVSLLMVSLCAVAKEKGSTVISGQSLTELGQYTINLSPEVIKIDDEVLDTYQLVYSESNAKILIGVKKTKKCRNFIVRTDGFEIEYICNKHVFGVKKVNEKYRKVDLAIVNAKLDNSQYYTQSVISQNPKNEEELLGLIACYFPLLIKELSLELHQGENLDLVYLLQIG